MFADKNVEKQALALMDLYAKAQKEIQSQIAKALAKGNSVEYLKQMVENVRQINLALLKQSRLWCEKAIPMVMLEAADAMGDKLPERAKIRAGFGDIHQQAALVLAENTFRRLEEVTKIIGRRTEDIYRTLALDAVRGSVIGYETWRQTAQRYREELAEKGVTGFTDAQGREWNMRTYANMVARTTTMEAHLQGTMNRIVENGFDLVRVSEHVGSCKLCIPWEGRVLSITGKTKGYPTVDEARAAGLFHPNCRHALSMVVYLDDEIEAVEQELADSENANVSLFPTIDEMNAQIFGAGSNAERYDIFMSHARGLAKQELGITSENIHELWQHSTMPTMMPDENGSINFVYKTPSADLDLTIDSPEIVEILQRYSDKTWAEYHSLVDELKKYMSTNAMTSVSVDARRAEMVLTYMFRDAGQNYLRELLPVNDEGSQAIMRARAMWSGIQNTLKRMRNTSKLKQEYPKAVEWLSKHVSPKLLEKYPVELTVESIDREYCTGNEIHLGRQTKAQTVIHEIGHVMAFNSTNAKILIDAWFRKRTAGLPLEQIYKGTSEYGYRDKFFNHYVGKVYEGFEYQGTEVFSMGLEHMFVNPAQFLISDPEHFMLTYGIMRGLGI